MLRLINFLIDGCFHRWKTNDERNLICSKTFKMLGKRIYLQCEKCGCVKIKDLKTDKLQTEINPL